MVEMVVDGELWSMKKIFSWQVFWLVQKWTFEQLSVV